MTECINDIPDADIDSEETEIDSDRLHLIKVLEEQEPDEKELISETSKHLEACLQYYRRIAAKWLEIVEHNIIRDDIKDLFIQISMLQIEEYDHVIAAINFLKTQRKDG